VGQSPLTGTVLDDRYKIGALLGSGAMGEVYRAEQVRLKRQVAVKVLRSPSPDLMQRFEREAQVLSRLKHSGIAGVVDFGMAGGTPYLVMELVDGRALEDALAEGAAIPPNEAIPLLVQLCEALDHAHSQGVLHRDLKPSNILIENGRARIVDFGIARLLSDDKDLIGNLTASGMIVGTPRYASPEQAMGMPLDFRSDLYSLGAVAYRMISGRPPFDADAPAAILTLHATQEPEPLLKVSGLPDTAAPLCDAIHKLLSKAPQDRFPSAAAAADAFRALHVERPSAPADVKRAPLAADLPTQNLSIVFTEVEGWAERLMKLTYEKQAQLSALHDALALSVATAFGGRHIKAIQETHLYSFPSPTRAVKAATAMMDRFAKYSESAPPELKLTLRIGVSTGEVRVEEGDVFGEPVNIAARVKALAAFGEIVLTHSVYLAMNKNEAPTEPIGQRTLKGIPEPVMIHRVTKTEGASLPYGGVALEELKLGEVRAEDAPSLVRGRWRMKLDGVQKRWGSAVLAVSVIGLLIFAKTAVFSTSLPQIELPPLAIETRAMIAQKKPSAAIKTLEDAVEKNKDDAKLHAALAHAYVHGGRKADALPHFAWAAKRAPEGFDLVYLRDLLVLTTSSGQNGKKAKEILAALGQKIEPFLEVIAKTDEDESVRKLAGEELDALAHPKAPRESKR
jgi:class 3 adenylate cyclase/tRNA A-37 threonylcarbamoyl transferase component Bud32